MNETSTPPEPKADEPKADAKPPELCPRIAESVAAQIAKAVVGQEPIIESLLVALLARGHVLLEGVPGTAKTLIAKCLARTLKADFARIQFTPDLMPSDVLGTNVWNPQTAEFSLRRGPVFTDILLADEINRAPAKTQSALLEVMEERQATIDGEAQHLGPLFTVIATQNPVEYEGTYPLPEAQLDRFMLKLLIDYPSADSERAVLERYHQGFDAHRLDEVHIEAVADAETIGRCRDEVQRIVVEPSVLDYIRQIVDATRNTSEILLGGSPRAGVNILLAAKALSALRGKFFVGPDEIKEVATSVLRHRIVLQPEAEIEGVLPDDAIRRVLEQVDVPR